MALSETQASNSTNKVMCYRVNPASNSGTTIAWWLRRVIDSLNKLAVNTTMPFHHKIMPPATKDLKTPGETHSDEKSQASSPALLT